MAIPRSASTAHRSTMLAGGGAVRRSDSPSGPCHRRSAAPGPRRIRPPARHTPRQVARARDRGLDRHVGVGLAAAAAMADEQHGERRQDPDPGEQLTRCQRRCRASSAGLRRLIVGGRRVVVRRDRGHRPSGPGGGRLWGPRRDRETSSQRTSAGDERDGVDDLGVAGAAAQVAGDRIHGSRPHPGRRRHRDRRAPPSIPGVQMPHWAPPVVRNARCSSSRPWRWRVSAGARPSTVRISAFVTWQNGTRHESTGAPSTSTVHAPHSPSPQPSLVPVKMHRGARREAGASPGRRPRRACR